MGIVGYYFYKDVPFNTGTPGSYQFIDNSARNYDKHVSVYCSKKKNRRWGKIRNKDDIYFLVMIVITYIDIVMKKEEKATWFSSLMAVGHVLKSSLSCKCIPMKGTDNNI